MPSKKANTRANSKSVRAPNEIPKVLDSLELRLTVRPLRGCTGRKLSTIWPDTPPLVYLSCLNFANYEERVTSMKKVMRIPWTWGKYFQLIQNYAYQYTPASYLIGGDLNRPLKYGPDDHFVAHRSGKRALVAIEVLQSAGALREEVCGCQKLCLHFRFRPYQNICSNSEC